MLGGHENHVLETAIHVAGELLDAEIFQKLLVCKKCRSETAKHQNAYARQLRSHLIKLLQRDGQAIGSSKKLEGPMQKAQ